MGLPSEGFKAKPQNSLNFTEWCIFRAGMAGAMGGVTGLAFGAFMSSAGSDPTMVGSAAADTEWASRAGLRRMAREMGSTMKSYAKTFAVCGLAYSACECDIEKEFAQKNLMTAVAAGCVAGAVLGVKGGPSAMAMGCAGFAGFSAVIELVLDS
jgi:import inner membrane translocase subunit TIM22